METICKIKFNQKYYKYCGNQHLKIWVSKEVGNRTKFMLTTDNSQKSLCVTSKIMGKYRGSLKQDQRMISPQSSGCQWLVHGLFWAWTCTLMKSCLCVTVVIFSWELINNLTSLHSWDGEKCNNNVSIILPKMCW